MGSSRKHKESERDRDGDRKKRKRKHRSRSRTRSPERRYRDDDRADRGHHDDRRDRDRDRGGRDEDKRRRHEDEQDRPGPVKEEKIEIQNGGGGGTMSMSIEETNKLRAQLGMKPLENKIPGLDGEMPSEEKESLKDDVHVPALNLAEIKKSKDLKEKLAEMKKKRQLNTKLGKVKTLGESDSDEDSAANWVKQSRIKEQEKKKAAQRAKMLEEMDEEFGVSDLVDEAFKKDREKVYSSKHLKGFTVKHDVSSIEEGKNVILTLQDKGVLDEEDDVLENVNIVDDEKAKKNVDNKSSNPAYKPYDEPEFDEYGVLKAPSMLSKYNEEIEGVKQETFEIGSGGKYDAQLERAMKEMRAELQKQGQSLQMAVPKLASEYYTADEMSKFKKVKKKQRKIRKKDKPLTADDILKLRQGADDREGDLGSRKKQVEPAASVQQSEWGPAFVSGMGAAQETDMDIDESEQQSNILGPLEDSMGVHIVDEPEQELQKALEKTRKLKHMKKNEEVSDIAMKILSSKPQTENAVGIHISLNSTSEFCRTLGDIPTYGLSGNREEDRDEILDIELELMNERKIQEETEQEVTGGWEEVEMMEEPLVEIQYEDKRILDDEPILNSGIGSALKLASNKGFLEKDVARLVNAKIHTSLTAKNYSVEDKNYRDIDEKYKKRDRFSSGIITDFKEKDGYKPEVKLEYIDEGGRSLNQKEAFRQLSHRFHGKGSGKKKTEKRAKKIEEDKLLLQMNPLDTPLNTVALLQQKQAQEKTPYIVLTGGGKTLSSGVIAKTSR